jgi:hypothetical protein
MVQDDPNFWTVVERYPNLKEEVGSLSINYEISFVLVIKNCQVVNCLMCFSVGISTFCLNI